MPIEKDNYSCHDIFQNAQLTFKEREVFSIAKKGICCKDISKQLFVSVETVKTHRKKIIKKLGLQGKLEFRQFIMDFMVEESILQHEKSPQNHP